MMSNRTFFMAFRTWEAASSKGRKVNDLQRKILRRLQHGMVFEVFSVWSASVGEAFDRRRNVLKKAAMRLAHATLVKTFDAWHSVQRQAVEARERREQLAVKMAARMRIPYVVMTFDAWASHVEKSVAIKKRAAYAIGPGRLKHIVMRTWAYHVRETKRQAEEDWVMGLIEEKLPAIVDVTVDRELQVRASMPLLRVLTPCLLSPVLTLVCS